MRPGCGTATIKGVWHLAETVADDPATANGVHEDSTTNGNDGDQNNNDDIAGRIAGGQDFDVTADYIVIDDAADDIDGDEGAVSAWIKMDPMDGRGIVFNAHDDDDNNFRMHWLDSGVFRFNYRANAVPVTETDPGATDTDGLWHLVAMTWDTAAGADGEMKAYIDGAQVGTTQTALGSWTGDGVMDVCIGAQADDKSLLFNGIIDEVRISDTARSADWIATEYNNQRWPNKAQHPAEGFITVVRSVCEAAAPVTCGSTTAGSIETPGAWDAFEVTAGGRHLARDLHHRDHGHLRAPV